MTNQHSHSLIDHAELRAGIAAHADLAAAQSGYATEGRGPHLITRQGGQLFWSLTIRAGGQAIRACTGTADRLQAHAIAAAIHADAAAGRFASKAPPTDARALALRAAIVGTGALPIHECPSETTAGTGQQELRIPGFREA